MAKPSYQQVGDLIDDVRGMHRKVRDAVSERAATSGDERSELLLRFIEEHERFIETALAEAGGPGRGQAVLRTWLQFGAGAVTAETFRDLDDTSQLDDDALVEAVIRAEEALAQLYRVIAGSTDAPRVRSFFESLAQMEDAAERRYAKAKLDSRDL